MKIEVIKLEVPVLHLAGSLASDFQLMRSACHCMSPYKVKLSDRNTVGSWIFWTLMLRSYLPWSPILYHFYEILWLVPINQIETTGNWVSFSHSSDIVQIPLSSNSVFQNVRVTAYLVCSLEPPFSHLMSFKLSCFLCFLVCILFPVQVFHKSQETNRYFVLKMDCSILGSFVRVS